MIPTDKIPAKPAAPTTPTIGDIPLPVLTDDFNRNPKLRLKTQYSQPHLFVILVCPRCHTRVEASYDEWCVSKLPGSGLKKFWCKNLLCDGKELVYHKMVEE